MLRQSGERLNTYKLPDCFPGKKLSRIKNVKYLTKFITIVAVSAFFSSPATAQLVIPPSDKIVPDTSKQVSYLVITPIVTRGTPDTISFYSQVRRSFTRSDAAPKNTELLNGEGWDGSVSFKVTGSPAEIENSIQQIERRLNTRQNIQRFKTRIDGIRYPVGPTVRGLDLHSAKYDQWMYATSDTDKGAANIFAPNVSETGAGITIAVIDTGFIDHPDLKKVGGYDFITDDRSSNDESPGRDPNPQDEGDFRLPEESPRNTFEPSSWHGAHVQGTISGQYNTDKRYQGIAPGSDILAVRVLGRFGGRDQDIVDSIAWAIGDKVDNIINDNPANIINLSLGAQSDVCPEHYQKIFARAREKNVTVIVAAGNDELDASKFSPANCDNVITVSSNSREGRLANYSNFGERIDISAPGGETFYRFYEDGDELYRATPQNGVVSTISSEVTNYTGAPNSFIYRPYQGTSMAAPVVSGIVALIQEAALAKNGNLLSPEEIRDILQETAAPFPSTTERGLQCDKSKCGAGIVDAGAAIAQINGNAVITPPVSPEVPHISDVKVENCMSSYEIVHRLLGKEAAEKIGPKPDKHPCDVY